MKNVILALIILVIAVGVLLESRYALVVQAPIVARIDRLTGDVWIANSGVWRKINMPPQEKAPAPAQAVQSKSK